MKRRLLFVNHSMRMGGIETMIRDFAVNLDPAKYEVSVAVFSGGGALVDELVSRSVPVYDLLKREGIDWQLIARLRRLLQERQIDVVHCHNHSAWAYSVLASRRMPHVRVVHTAHSRIEPTLRRHALHRWLARRTHRVRRYPPTSRIPWSMMSVCRRRGCSGSATASISFAFNPTSR